jgi:hypothetical protein
LKERRIIMRNRILCFVLGLVSLSLISCGNIFTAQVDAGLLLPSFEVDSLVAYPTRLGYTENNNVFTPMTELSVLAVYVDGTTWKVPISDEGLELFLKDDPVPMSKEAVTLDMGENRITVFYTKKSTEFTLTVWAGDGPGSGDEGTTGGNSGTSIEIDVDWKG